MKTLRQIFCTKIGWALICFILGSVFLGLNNYGYNWAYIPMNICYGYILLLVIIAIVYAWIINPLKSRRK